MGSDASLVIYEIGVGIINPSLSYATNDQCTITYDGVSVKYYKNSKILVVDHKLIVSKIIMPYNKYNTV